MKILIFFRILIVVYKKNTANISLNLLNNSNHMVKIAESELILNKNGSIYHLNLLPEQLADTIITVGDPDRVFEVSKYFDSIQFKIQNREFVTHTGTLSNKKITVLSTGIGTDNIDIVFNELYALSAIDFIKRTLLEVPKKLTIIRIGTSGSLRKDIELDSVVISEYALGLEGLMNFYPINYSNLELDFQKKVEHELRNDFSFLSPYFTHSSSILIDQLGKEMIKGITATCQGFYHPQGRSISNNGEFKSILDTLKTIDLNGRHITNFEMETAGILGLSQYFGFDACSISLILANRINQTFSKNAEQKMDELIKNILIKLIN